MFIRIPGDTFEGDDACSATSHPTLGAALEEKMSELQGNYTVVVLDATGPEVAVAATVRGFNRRSDAEQALADVREGTAQLVPARPGSLALVWRPA